MIEGNWFNGGNYTIYLRGKGVYGAPTSVTIRDNYFGRDYRYGIRSFSSNAA